MTNARDNVAKLRGIVDVTEPRFGAKGDGVTDDTAAIQAAIDYVAAITVVDSVIGFDSFGGVVTMPPGTFLVSNTLTLRRGVTLSGAGRRATILLINAVSFPLNSRVITLGQLGSNEFAYNSLVKHLGINCAFRADLVAVESDHAAEGAGLSDVFIRGTFRPVRLYKQTGLTVPDSPTEVLLENCEFWLEGSGGPAAPRYAVDIDNCEQSQVIRFITIFDLNTNMGVGSAAVRVNGCRAEISHIHTERMETCVLITGTASGSCQVSIESLEHYNGNAVTGIYINNSAAATTVVADNVFVVNSGTAYTVQNTVTGELLTNGAASRIGRYNYQGSSASSFGRYSQLVFGNVNSAVVNELDYYLEGSFTPTISFGGASVGVTYATQSGNYTRIGNRVLYDIHINLTAKGSSIGELRIGDLPFAASNAAVTYPATLRLNNVQNGLGTFMTIADILGTDTKLRILTMNVAGATEIQVPATDAEITNTSILSISGQYRCA